MTRYEGSSLVRVVGLLMLFVKEKTQNQMQSREKGESAKASPMLHATIPQEA